MHNAWIHSNEKFGLNYEIIRLVMSKCGDSVSLCMYKLISASVEFNWPHFFECIPFCCFFCKLCAFDSQCVSQRLILFILCAVSVCVCVCVCLRFGLKSVSNQDENVHGRTLVEKKESWFETPLLASFVELYVCVCSCGCAALFDFVVCFFFGCSVQRKWKVASCTVRFNKQQRNKKKIEIIIVNQIEFW